MQKRFLKFVLKVLGVNILGALAIIAWAVVWSVVLFGLLDWLGVLRIPMDVELIGADKFKHKEAAYFGFPSLAD